MNYQDDHQWITYVVVTGFALLIAFGLVTAYTNRLENKFDEKMGEIVYQLKLLDVCHH
jgi:hypothetical protein